MHTTEADSLAMSVKPVVLLPLETVLARTGLSATTVRKGIIEGWFPTGRKIGPRCVRWLESELEDWARELPRAELQQAA